jgi:hypothetical protein
MKTNGDRKWKRFTERKNDEEMKQKHDPARGRRATTAPYK